MRVSEYVILAEAEVPVAETRQVRHRWNLVVIGVIASLFAVLAWQRRWMSDDGLIVLRTVRQILDGNGPVYNVGERVEVNTSALWTAILALLGLTGLRLEWLAVGTGLACAVGGLVLGLDAARRLHRGAVLPAGVLVVCTVPPFLDFATSGLETGLVTLWLGATWWLLVRAGTARRIWPVALVIGLGPLVRPELALFSMVMFGALLMVCRPGWRRAVAWLAVAGSLPLVYQVFRMGYYGLLTPNTALAKEASGHRWMRGLYYLTDLNDAYLLWLPLLALAGVLAWILRSNPRRVVTLAPVVAGIGLAIYTVRVGGDFMHGRMLLPAIFAVLLPVLVLPAKQWAVAAGVGAWALVAGTSLRVPYAPGFAAGTQIADERAFWVNATGREHPILAEDFQNVSAVRDPAVLPDGRILSYSIGAIGMFTPLEVTVHDPIGLSNPLAAHASNLPDGRAGHDKRISADWDMADTGYGGPAVKALACPAIAEMLESVRAPLTPQQFWRNLRGSFDRTSLRYDPDPARACSGAGS